MFDIKRGISGQLQLCGRLDASQAATVREALDAIVETATIDFVELDERGARCAPGNSETAERVGAQHQTHQYEQAYQGYLPCRRF